MTGHITQFSRIKVDSSLVIKRIFVRVHALADVGMKKSLIDILGLSEDKLWKLIEPVVNLWYLWHCTMICLHNAVMLQISFTFD